MKATLPIVGGYSIERDPKIDCQRTINMYAVSSPEGKNPSALVALPGIISRLEFESGTFVRNIFVYGNVMYVFVSNKFYKVDENLDATLLGTIDTSLGFIDITAIQTLLFFCDGQDGWTYTFATGTLAKITGQTNFPTLPTSAVMLDGFLVTHKGGTNGMYVSTLNYAPIASPGTPLGEYWPDDNDFYLESEPDTIQTLFVFKRRLYVFGNVTTEVWYDAGESPVPFRRDNNMIFSYGCAAPSSVAVGGTDEDKSMFWLASDSNGVGSIMMTNGGIPKRISTVAVDYAIKQYNNPADAVGYAYKEDGHVFYEISFTEDNQTWVYDQTTGLWFERQMQNRKRFIANCHGFFEGRHYVGSYLTPTLYEMSSDYLDEDEDVTVRTRIFRHLSDPHYRKIRINRLTIDLTEGRDIAAKAGEIDKANLLLEYGTTFYYVIGLEDGATYMLEDGGYIEAESSYSADPGTNYTAAYRLEENGLYLLESSIESSVDEPSPYVDLCFSKDGGISYGNWQRLESGATGERLHRTIYRRLGSGRDWVFKLRLSNRRKLFVLGASIDFEVSGR